MNNRNYGIDMLRMISMFMVVILHVLGQGGVYPSTIKLSGGYEIAWLLEIIAFCAVNCFGIISGYVGVDAEFRINKAVSMWLLVVFYTLLITGCYAAFFPEEITWEHWLKAFLPVSKAQYWYFKSYFGMFFFIPYFNKLLNSLKEKELLHLGLAIIMIFSVWQTIIQNEIFGTQKGYNLLWLSLLYLLGGIIKKLNHKITLRKCMWIIIFWGGVFLTWGWKYIVELKFPESSHANFFVSYISPTVLMCAVAMVMIFQKIECDNRLYKQFIKIGAPSAFSVYIIHAHPLIYDNILFNRFTKVAEYSPIHLAIAVIAIALAIYISCTIVDMIRIKLFKWFRINEISRYLGEKADNALLFIGKFIIG